MWAFSTNVLCLCILIGTACCESLEIRAVPPPPTGAVQLGSPTFITAPAETQQPGMNMSIITEMYENICKFIGSGIAECHSFTKKALEYCDVSYEDVSRQTYLQHQQSGMMFEETKAWMKSFKKGGLRAESVTGLIKNCVQTSLKYLSKDYDVHWAHAGETEGITVWKCKPGGIIATDKAASRWPCVKSKSIIDAPPSKVADLLFDSSRIHLTNKYSQGRTDVQKIGDKTKIVWNRTKIPFTVRPYDFCSLIHVVKADDKDSYMIVTKSIEHDLVPKHPDYTRSEMYLGVNIIEPLKSDPRKSEITIINHVRYSGIPPFLATRNFYTGTTNYLKQLKKAARDL